MDNKKLKSLISSAGVPRLIIGGFFLVLLFSAIPLGMDIQGLLTNLLTRVGMNGILVLAMVPGIRSGIGLNFGIAVGIVGGIVGGLISIELGLHGWTALLVAILIGVSLAAVMGYLYGVLLNRVKGSEMSVSTYVGFSIISLMNIAWLVLPFKSTAIRWPIGVGLRNTVSLQESSGVVLTEFLSFTIGKVVVPTGALLLLALCCFVMYLFLNSRLGIAMSAAGSNPRFAQANGINVDKMRLLGTTVSTATAAVGIIAYAQCFGFIQLYTAPLMMSFAAVAAVLIGGASLSHAKVTHVIIGVILFQGIISMGLPIANRIIPEGNLSEVIRLIISNGIILYSLTKAKGGRANA